MSTQADSLSGSRTAYRKTVRSGEGGEESAVKTAAEWDWKKEFALFSEADLQKKAYAGKFTVDSVLSEGKKTVRYTSENTKIRLVKLLFEEAAVLPELEALIQTGNLFYRSEYRLHAIPYNHYRIEGKQEVFFPASVKTFSVDWEAEP